MEDEVMTAEAARAQAEARRQRILDKANQRLGVVSGEQVLATEEKEAAAAKAARIRAARQRRYGKKDAVVVAVAVEPTTTTTTTTTLDDSKKEEPAEPVAADPPEETPAPHAPVPTANLDDIKVTAANDQCLVEPSGDSSNEPKKKYVGVARMRRQMIQKKKLEADQSEDVGDATDHSTTARKGHVDPAVSLPPPPLKVRAFPIYMHILTIFLLFLAGMDISFQQDHQNRRVYSELAIRKYGIPLIHRSLAVPSYDENSATSSILHNVQVPSDVDQALKDEFQEEDDSDASTPNIDPLLRVDLDELTKGPGIIKGLARGAVSVHRSLLWLVYLLPLSMVQALLRIPQALLRSPPTPCLVALAVRHLVGKTILGAGIPEPTKESDKGPIDILAMAKNFVSNFLTTTFPTVVGFYEAFTHLRTDMYILLCGVFTGFVWLHLQSTTTMHHPSLDIVNEPPSSAYEEL